MRLRVVKNKHELYPILFDKKLWDGVVEDGISMSNCSFVFMPTNGWLVYENEDKMAIGAIYVVHTSNCCSNIHVYLLHAYRKYCRQLLKDFFKWVVEKSPKHIQKVTAQIPFNRKIVYNLAKKCGFKDEGVDRHSYLKKGKYYDRWHLGITRAEMEEKVWEA